MVAGLIKRLNWAMADRLGFLFARKDSLYPWQAQPPARHVADPATLPSGAEHYLRPDNPRLAELISRYRNVDPAVTAPLVWNEGKLAREDLLYFRGDNPYVWQSRGLGMSELAYALTYYHVRVRHPDIVDRLDEDGAFGAHVHRFDGITVSRDLLDSAGEIDFLRRHARIDRPGCALLDIGAGYGRLPHRLSQALPGLAIYATDAFAPSTFLCEYYLAYRKAARTRVIPLDEVDTFLADTPIHVATNVHSFSECRPAAIEWWVSRLARHRVPYLMVVPNRVSPDSGHCLTNEDHDMEPLLERHGYRCVVREPRYKDPVVQAYGVDPSQLTLFTLA